MQSLDVQCKISMTSNKSAQNLDLQRKGKMFHCINNFKKAEKVKRICTGTQHSFYNLKL
jgi:hypothetical protein